MAMRHPFDWETPALTEILAERGYTGGPSALTRDARAWITDCDRGASLPPEDISGLTDTEVLTGIARNVDGGIRGFITSLGYPAPADTDDERKQA